MKQSLRLGRVAGIVIGVQWSALVIIVLIALTLATGVLPSTLPHQPTAVYWAVALPGAVMFLACLLAHELAHSLVALHYGMRVGSITLWMLGGVSEVETEAPNAKADLAVAAAGPLTSLALGVLFGAAAAVAATVNASPLITGALLWLAVINIVLGLFNLLPGAPLDGGRVLRAVLWRRYHEHDDEKLLYPAVAETLGGADPTGPMSRGHAEIAERTRRIVLLAEEADVDPAALPELRRALQELHAVLRLYFALEEENFYVLADEPGPVSLR